MLKKRSSRRWRKIGKEEEDEEEQRNTVEVEEEKKGGNCLRKRGRGRGGE